MIGYYDADNIDHYALDFDYCENDMQWKHKNKLKHKLLHQKFISKTVKQLLKLFKTDNEWENYNEKNIRPLFNIGKAKNIRKRKGKIRLISRIDAIKLQNKIDNWTSQKSEIFK